MSKKLALPLFWCLSVLTACTTDKPEISVACESTRLGSYLIKWETFPAMDGMVKIYASSNPDSFDLQIPIADQSIKENFQNIPRLKDKLRPYFKLVFDKKYPVITAERIIKTDGIYNMRDLGGYYNKEKRQVKWGMLYRSSSLAHANKQDINILNNLGIKSTIDLRTEAEIFSEPSKYSSYQSFNLPLASEDPMSFFRKIISMEMLKGDVIIKLQDFNAALLENNSESFIKLFDILLNKNNYPIDLYCALGKDRAGIASALILAVLDVPMDKILQDFMLSNDNIEFNKLVPNASQYSREVQEALTVLFSSHEQSISYALGLMEKKYGSLSNYFEKELKLTDKKREKLKNILLYSSDYE